MILTLGCLVVLHRRWLRGPPARAIPFALVLAAGVSALGVAFGVWALVAVGGARRRARRRAARAAPATRGARSCWSGCAVDHAPDRRLADLDTRCPDPCRSPRTSPRRATPATCRTPLRAIQVFGVWLGGSYKLAPAGQRSRRHRTCSSRWRSSRRCSAPCTLLRLRAYALAGWLALMLLAWLAVSRVRHDLGRAPRR